MTFEAKKILTGVIPKVSKITGKPYTILTYLNDNGSTFTSMMSEDCKLPTGLKQLSDVKVKFEVTFFNGNVSGLKTVGIELL